MAPQYIRYSCWYVFESIFGPLSTYNKAKKWTVPIRNGCWQCWKGCWGSETPRLHGVSCESVDWNPYSSIGFARQCSCTTLWLNPTATQWKRSYMLTCSWVHDPVIAGHPIFFLPRMVWHNCIFSNKSWSQPFCRRPQGETLGVLDTSFWNSSERTQQQTLYLSPMVCSSSQEDLWSLIRLILPKYAFLNLPRDVLRSTARFRLRVHTLRVETATWNQSYFPTCDLCDADDIQDEQHVLFHCANPHMISLRRKYAPLFPPTGAHDVFTFLSQNSDKLNFFLHELRQKFPGSVEMRLKYGWNKFNRISTAHGWSQLCGWNQLLQPHFNRMFSL